MTLATLAPYFMAAAGIPLAGLTFYAFAFPERHAPKINPDERN